MGRSLEVLARGQVSGGIFLINGCCGRAQPEWMEPGQAGSPGFCKEGN